MHTRSTHLITSRSPADINSSSTMALATPKRARATVTSTRQAQLSGSITKRMSAPRRSRCNTPSKSSTPKSAVKPLDFNVSPPSSPASTLPSTPCSLSPPSSPSKEDPVIEREQVHEDTDIPLGRESHHAQLLSLLSESSRAVYVCGTPGTGKTMTVKSVVRTLCRTKLDDLQHIFVNCASLSCPNALLVQIANQLHIDLVSTDSNALISEIRRVLDLKKIQHPQHSVLIVVDEIDLLISSSSSSSSSATMAPLYALLELPTIASNVGVLAIANAIDMPTRLLPLLASSPSRPHTVQFLPYDSSTLVRIAQDTLFSKNNPTTSLPPIAISLAAKKIAAAGGDARLMLNVLRQTLHTLSQPSNTLSAIALVASLASCRNTAASRAVTVIKSLPVHQQIALVVAANAAHASDSGRASAAARRKRACLAGLYEAFRKICSQVVRITPLGFTDFADVVTGALQQHALVDVVVNKGKGKGKGVCTVAEQQVRLKCRMEDVRAGVNEHPILARLIA